MSRGALWQPTAPKAAPASGTGIIPQPRPTPPTGALSALPVRSGLDPQVKLARIADLVSEAAQIIRELSEVPLAVPRERALMCDVSEPKKLLSVRDLAQRLGLSERTVRRLRQRGELPRGIEIASVIRWRPEEIDAWLAAGGSK